MKHTSGHGLTHGYEHDTNLPIHEARGAHGVSNKWLRERVGSAAAKASPERVSRFKKNMAKTWNSRYVWDWDSPSAGKKMAATMAANAATAKGKPRTTGGRERLPAGNGVRKKDPPRSLGTGRSGSGGINRKGR